MSSKNRYADFLDADADFHAGTQWRPWASVPRSELDPRGRLDGRAAPATSLPGPHIRRAVMLPALAAPAPTVTPSSPSEGAPDPAPIAAAVDALLAHFRGGGVDGALDGAVGLPPAVVGAMPSPVGSLVGAFEHDHERGVVLVSSLVTASALLPNVRFSYHGHSYGPTLMASIVARAGSGKGRARFGEALARAADRRVLAAAQADHGPDDGGPAPGFGVVLPGNASQAAVSDHLSRTPVPTLLVETEIDAYVDANKQDWGATDAMLRAAFEHEPVRVARLSRTVNVERPEVAVLLAGTPSQFLSLIPSAENGLFSRFFWFTFAGEDGWLGPWAEREGPSAESVARRGAAALDALHASLAARERPLELVFSGGQRDRHEEVFRALVDWRRRTGQDPLDSVVKRAGVVACRIATVLAVLREHAAGRALGGVDVLEPDDADFEAALALALVGVDHAFRLYTRLPTRPASKLLRSEQAALRLLPVLPERFTRNDLIEIAEKEGLDIGKSTVDKYRGKLEGMGLIEADPCKNGVYDRTDGADPVPGVGGVLYESDAPPNYRGAGYEGRVH